MMSQYILSKYKNNQKSFPITALLTRSPIQLPFDIKAKLRVVLTSALSFTIPEL